jgi:succinylglutamate desuccinylase
MHVLLYPRDTGRTAHYQGAYVKEYCHLLEYGVNMNRRFGERYLLQIQGQNSAKEEINVQQVARQNSSDMSALIRPTTFLTTAVRTSNPTIFKGLVGKQFYLIN